jgi:hypothetical protein
MITLILCVCETCSRAPGEEHGLRMFEHEENRLGKFENNTRSRIFGTNRGAANSCIDEINAEFLTKIINQLPLFATYRVFIVHKPHYMFRLYSHPQLYHIYKNAKIIIIT